MLQQFAGHGHTMGPSAQHDSGFEFGVLVGATERFENGVVALLEPREGKLDRAGVLQLAPFAVARNHGAESVSELVAGSPDVGNRAGRLQLLTRVLGAKQCRDELHAALNGGGSMQEDVPGGPAGSSVRRVEEWVEDGSEGSWSDIEFVPRQQGGPARIAVAVLTRAERLGQ